MLRLTITIIFALGLLSCRASFESINNKEIISNDDDLNGPDKEVPIEGGATVQDKPFNILENVHKLYRPESEAHDCNGTLIIRETGRDLNRDNILQSTEVEDIKTECVPDGTECPTQSQTRCNTPTQKSP